jgi:hypothetical protein
LARQLVRQRTVRLYFPLHRPAPPFPSQCRHLHCHWAAGPDGPGGGGCTHLRVRRPVIRGRPDVQCFSLPASTEASSSAPTPLACAPHRAPWHTQLPRRGRPRRLMSQSADRRPWRFPFRVPRQQRSTQRLWHSPRPCPRSLRVTPGPRSPSSCRRACGSSGPATTPARCRPLAASFEVIDSGRVHDVVYQEARAQRGCRVQIVAADSEVITITKLPRLRKQAQSDSTHASEAAEPPSVLRWAPCLSFGVWRSTPVSLELPQCDRDDPRLRERAKLDCQRVMKSDIPSIHSSERVQGRAVVDTQDSLCRYTRHLCERETVLSWSRLETRRRTASGPGKPGLTQRRQAALPRSEMRDPIRSTPASPQRRECLRRLWRVSLTEWLCLSQKR